MSATEARLMTPASRSRSVLYDGPRPSPGGAAASAVSPRQSDEEVVDAEIVDDGDER
jgi:hypothetical protein